MTLNRHQIMIIKSGFTKCFKQNTVSIKRFTDITVLHVPNHILEIGVNAMVGSISCLSVVSLVVGVTGVLSAKERNICGCTAVIISLFCYYHRAYYILTLLRGIPFLASLTSRCDKLIRIQVPFAKR